MRSLYVIFLTFLSFSVFSDEIKIKVNPGQPTFNEVFSIEFTIKTNTDEEPIIDFKPYGLEVISRSELGTSTRLSYINGRSTMEKTISFSYDVIAPRSGTAFLRRIRVELNGKILKHETISINVLKEPLRSKKIFAQAEVKKKSVYVGESILVRYYLYNRSDIPLRSTDIKKFPKLDKFLKRFHQEQIVPERVRIDGEMYTRRVIYTAQLYGQTPGIFKIDPIKMKISYSGRSSSFGGFGVNLGFGRTKSVNVTSKNIEIEVMSLPATGMENHFSGLVGKHDFRIKMSKNKFIANEPIEILLEVEGDGALELFESPSLINDPSIEEFEKNSEWIKKKNFTALKKVSYTYLGREDANIKNIIIPISFFDPEKEEYITKNLELGSITIAGIATPSGSEQGSIAPRSDKIPLDEKSLQKISGNFKFKPLLKVGNSFLYNIKDIFVVLSALLLFIILYVSWKFFKGKAPKEVTLFEDIYKNGLDYSQLHSALRINGEELSMLQVVLKLPLSQEARSYFEKLVFDFNTKYAKDGVLGKVDAQKKHFKELEKVLRNHGKDKVS